MRATLGIDLQHGEKKNVFTCIRSLETINNNLCTLFRKIVNRLTLSQVTLL